MKSNTDIFIKKATLIHGDKYLYDRVVYKGNKVKVEIGCLSHGYFWQSPSDHTSKRKRGCRECGKKRTADCRRQTTEQFVAKSKHVHSDKYLYDRAKYTADSNKIEIGCPTHGYFWQTASDHKHGYGCSDCGRERTVNARRKSTTDFIKDAVTEHGDYYGYDKVDYVNSHADVIITCPIHGDFKQWPSSHLAGRGCPKCGRKAIADCNRSTKEEFEEKANAVHNGKYTYGKFNYTNQYTKGIITCPIHGDFEKEPVRHIYQKVGCKKCANDAMRSNTEDFKNKASKVHGDDYTYDKVEYYKANLNVIITCHKHGDFEQTPNGHLGGHGCPKCGFEYLADLNSYTTDEFIQLAKKSHGEQYDYSNVKYINWKSDVEIICSKHGKFTQLAGGHILGNGCPKCGRENTGKAKRLDTKEFISRAMIKHGEKYEYGKANYIQWEIPVTIGCPKHGYFEQKPASHLSGHGCQICRSSQGEKVIRRYLVDHKIRFRSEYRFVSCRNKKPLPFDFVIWHSGKVKIIEFHGMQHYKPMGFGSSDPIEPQRRLERSILTDTKKEKWCKHKGIPLLVIPYTAKFKDIGQMIEYFFKDN